VIAKVLKKILPQIQQKRKKKRKIWKKEFCGSFFERDFLEFFSAVTVFVWFTRNL
jgi:hypothetical protein